MRKVLTRFLMAKIVALCLCGTVWAAPYHFGVQIFHGEPREASPTQMFATAIARAEGYWAPGSIPNRLNNPGDIRSHYKNVYPGQTGLYHGYVVFRTPAAGWRALYRQIEKIAAGESEHYSVNMTLRQLARKYATSPTWVKNVSSFLSVKPDTPLWAILDTAPRVEGVLSSEATPIYCRPDVIKAMNFIWTESRNGTIGVEASFILNGMPSAYSIEQESMTDEKMRQTVHVYPGQTFAMFHVHPIGGGMYPSTPENNYAGNSLGDTGFADKYGFDIYVVSSQGLTVYRPDGKVTVKLRDGMSWTSAKGCF